MSGTAPRLEHRTASPPSPTEDATVSIVVYWDYMCPWCYCALRRLEQVEADLGSSVRLRWQPFPLRPMPDARIVDDHVVEVFAAAEATLRDLDVRFAPRRYGDPLPRSSMAPLAAALAALRQGEEQFRRLHRRLFDVWLLEGADIANPQVVVSAAEDTGIDLAAFVRDMASGDAIRDLRRSYDQACALGVSTVPLAIFESQGRPRVVLRGAGTAEQYRDIALAVARGAAATDVAGLGSSSS
jgi:predicted DsbA family dithiol-disulfide isomerase